MEFDAADKHVVRAKLKHKRRMPKTRAEAGKDTGTMEKIVLIGAGSAMFTRGLVRDLIERGWEADLALVDVEEEALSVAEKLAQKMIEARSAPIRVAAGTDRRDLLEGATAVICTIGVGGRRAWERDVLRRAGTASTSRWATRSCRAARPEPYA